MVGRELTKMHEEIFRGTVSQALEFFTSENTRGEFTVIVAPTNFLLIKHDIIKNRLPRSRKN